MGACCSSSTNERRGNTSEFDSEERPRIFPSLPDNLSVQILARVPRGCYPNLKTVCKTWNNVLRDEILKVREKLGVKEELLYILLKDKEEKFHLCALDPISCKWYSLPRMPHIIQEEDSTQTGAGCNLCKAMGNLGIRLLSRLKDWFGSNDPLDRTALCDTAVGSLNGYLYVLGGSSGGSARRYVWRYDPRINEWIEVASMTTARAYCKTASLNNKLYAVGGVIRGRDYLTTLQSAEAYDPMENTWTRISGMLRLVGGDVQSIATGMVAFSGKLCVCHSLYSGPSFVRMHGEMYDPDASCWIEMPAGMGDGWPARQAGTKQSVVVNGNLYVLEPSCSLDSRMIKMYDPQKDCWNVVLRKVPILDFTDSQSPYLLAGFRGKLHIITKGNRDDIAILQVDTSKPGNASSSGDAWRSIANKNFGFMELVNCQVVEI